MKRERLKLTTAQALVRYLSNQFIEIDKQQQPLFAGVFGIFGHGNVTCLGEALHEVQDKLPTWRGQNEQAMALAAIAYAKAKLRRQIMVATSSIGPGATNMVTAAALAHANRLPILMLAGDSFANRRPDPVLQQIENFGAPSVTVNDAFRPVTRYWDRITHPEQIISSLPQAVATMLDPADCGPAFIGLCQDTQELAFDYPEEFFDPKTHTIPRPRPDKAALFEAVRLIRKSRYPLIISGGGVRYSQAANILAEMALKRNIPIVETIAGKGSLTHDHPAHVGPLGVIGSSSANATAAIADLVIAVGTRLQDFTTGSWTVFSQQTKIVSINTARWDANKHQAFSLVGDALEVVEELNTALAGWMADPKWLSRAKERFQEWNSLLDLQQKPGDEQTTTYAQVVGAVNAKAEDNDVMVTAAGGLPGETTKGWRVKSPNTYDCEFGYSCMGYELAGGWGAAMAADGKHETFVLLGDGSYLMMNSDIYSSVLSGHKMIVVVCDNGGYAVINRLQNFKGSASFNNLIKDSRIVRNFGVDFVQHAESMGALAREVQSIDELRQALDWARSNDRTTVISIATDAYTWTPGDADWDVGVPEVSKRAEVRAARAEHEKIRRKQRIGV